MRTVNAGMDRFIEYISDKNLYIYGIGDIYQRLMSREVYHPIHERVVGYIDNGKAGQDIEVFGKKYHVYDVGFLQSVGQGVVLLCGEKYMDEMYRALCGQQISDNIECFILPLIWTVTDGRGDMRIKELLSEDTNDCNRKIDKRIHCFWFSGEKKPRTYQKCIDSWRKVCPDYEIIEWNADNYDCNKNIFMKKAYEGKKWAFVSDYARLDVIYHFGGIYLDMDVELLKPLDPLLKFKAFFNFGTQYEIDLGSGFGSIKNNPLIGSLLQMYTDQEFCDEYENLALDKFVQPALIKEEFPKWGIRMDGSMQLVDDMLLLPRKYYSPVDDFFLQNFIQCDDTMGIHHYNAGWWTKKNHEQRRNRLSWVDIAKRLV